MSTFIDLHVIQTLPPSNVNRDDTGAPKSAVYGGVRRARVSSQAWKRAARKRFQQDLDTEGIGYRTKEAAELIGTRMAERGAQGTAEDLAAKAGEVLKVMGLKLEPKRASKKKDDAVEAVQTPYESTQYLTFFSADQIDKLAQLAMGEEKVTKKMAHDAADTDHGIALSLFGRMVADDTSLNVDASVQVAHALSTHAVDTEADYYTAVDDVSAADPDREDSGAGMIGTIEFASSTLYRYATITVDQLRENLGDSEAAGRAASAFALGFITSMPTGKQNTFANRTMPDAVLVTVRHDQPVNLVGAFEVPVPGENGYVQGSCEALAEYSDAVISAYGNPPSESYLLRVGQRTQAMEGQGESVSLDELLAAIGDAARREGAESS